jgi:hypothetical protein
MENAFTFNCHRVFRSGAHAGGGLTGLVFVLVETTSGDRDS